MEDVVKGEDTYRFAFQIMKHKFIEKDQIVFNYNDAGDLFYIVLQGKVSIKVPKTEVIELNPFEHQEFAQREEVLSIKELTEEEILQHRASKVSFHKKNLNVLTP